MELTVAIPTMRRWDKFLSKSLPTYLNHPFVKNVLICDETGEDIAAIRASEWATNPKLILKQNERRLGIYHNKRQCIELAPTEWVGVFDSDNFFDANFFNSLEAVWKSEGADSKTFYACGNGLFVKGHSVKELFSMYQSFRCTNTTLSQCSVFTSQNVC